MSASLFFAPPTYSRKLSPAGGLSIRALCERAGVPCKASGPFTNVSVVVEIAHANHVQIQATPTTVAAPVVRVILVLGGRDCESAEMRRSLPSHSTLILPENLTIEQARQALCALAYGAFDLVARESVRGYAWAQLRTPAGKPRNLKRARTNAERQAAFVAKRKKVGG